MELLRKTNINFIALRKVSFVVSAILVTLGIIAVVQLVRGQANLGIDFAGGTAVQVKFEKPVRLEDARHAIDNAGFRDSELQQFTEGNRLLIQVKKASAAAEGKVADQVVATLQKAFAANKMTVESTTEIGPKVGRSLQHDTLIAVIISAIGMIVYIAWRFEFSFGVAACVATYHDVLAILGIFFLLNKEVNLLLVTALLTLAGYSLTDTVVVYDRIRENLRLRTKDALDAVMNGSINEVLSRTIVTSSTVFLVCLALFFFGGEVLHDFSFALLIGIVVGTYSSVFVASPIVYEWRKGKKVRIRTKR
ncbi:MAG TPA: protein translocase subunit SecF [Thermodesulfobacteriota bacterium]|nr:protein translocase subunit SecF [Thermodesulfobacteriota bacterium]